MTEEKRYIAVFFDVDLPMVIEEARQIRLDRKKYTALVVDAVPGKAIELEDRYGLVGNFTVISSRTFQVKNSSENTLFLICDVKKAKVSLCTDWINQQKGVEKINSLIYRFWYCEKWCTGQINLTPEYEELVIRPNLNTNDIGEGEGVPVHKKFKR